MNVTGTLTSGGQVVSRVSHKHQITGAIPVPATNLGLAQSGQRTCLGRMWSEVRIFHPRPESRTNGSANNGEVARKVTGAGCKPVFYGTIGFDTRLATIWGFVCNGNLASLQDAEYQFESDSLHQIIGYRQSHHPNLSPLV